MPLTVDATFTIRATTFGAGNGSVWVAPQEVSGFGIPDPKPSDVDLWGQAGAVGNPEYAGVRVIALPVKIIADTAALAVTALQTLWTAWAASTVDIPLAYRVGSATFTVNGRPRGGKDDLSLLKVGIIDVLLRFDALNPVVTVT